MDRLTLKRALAVAALLVGSAGPSLGQQFEYTPYRGSNNTGQPAEPPPDNYTPTHQGVGAGPGYDSGAAAPPYQGAARQSGSSDAYSGNRAAASSGDAYSPSAPSGPAPSRGGYAPSGGAYSPSEDVFSPSHAGRDTAPPSGGDAYSPPAREGQMPPPRGVGGPPVRDADGLPRVEVQVAAPGDGIPDSVREHDARRAAIEGWRAKVADRFGPEFSQWRVALGKHLDCHPDRRDGYVCVASAQPVRGFDRDNPWTPDRHD